MKKIIIILFIGIICPNTYANEPTLKIVGVARTMHDLPFALYVPMVSFFDQPVSQFKMMALQLLVKPGDKIFIKAIDTSKRQWEFTIVKMNDSDPTGGGYYTLAQWIMRGKHNEDQRTWTEPNKRNSGIRRFQVYRGGVPKYELVTFVKDFRKNNLGEARKPAENYKNFPISFKMGDHPDTGGDAHTGGGVFVPQ